MTRWAGKASRWRDVGSSWTARLGIVCAVVLGLAMLAPAAAPAATVFFDDFESGAFGANWYGVDIQSGVDQGAFWTVLPRGQYVPVASGNYCLGVTTAPGHIADQTAEVLCGPFQLQGAPYPRLEFDLYRNMPYSTSYLSNRPVMMLGFKVYGTDGSSVKSMRTLQGSSSRWEHIVVPLDRWNSIVGVNNTYGENVANYYSPLYLSFEWSNSAVDQRDPLSFPQPGEGVFIDNVKVAYGAPEVASVMRLPSKSSIVTKRKRSFTLAVLVRDSRGGASYGASSVLQTSRNGRSGWKNTYQVVTNESGLASKTIRPTKKGTTYYRWVVAGKKTLKQKVVVK